jgi:peroxin-7
MTAAALTVPASGTEVLAIDWNKYRPLVLASAGVDKTARVWDCRMVSQPAAPEQRVGGACETTLLGHEYAIRRIQWSPHRPDALATASYDMTCRMYEFRLVFAVRRLAQFYPQMDNSANSTNRTYSGCSYRVCCWL